MKPWLLLALMLATATALAQSKDQLDKTMSYDGLEPVKVKGISLAYRRPGATLAVYKRVSIDPVDVRFSKNWNPKRPGSMLALSAEDREYIRTGVAKLVREQFVKAMQAKGTYPVVSEQAPDVLRLKIYIVNLYVNAPDVSGPGPSRTFVMSAGEMTLYMEMFDSESGQILARVADREEASTGPVATMANSATNIGAAEDVAAEWARILRNAFDRAHAATQN